MMMDLKHENGANVCTIYGRDIAKISSLDLGPTITFNLRRADGSWYGYHEVENLASLSGIQLRAGHVCWDDRDVLHGKPTGAVRISFGYMSTFEDAEKFLRFLEISFVAKHKSSNGKSQLSTEAVPLSGIGWQQLVGDVQLKSIMVYPVKSCAGFSMYSWPLSNMGLKYDREWLLKGPNDEILTQKKVPEMCYIHTFVDLEQGKLFLESQRCKEKMQISLAKNSFCAMEEMNVYGQRYEVMTYDDEVNMWFTEAIARPCTFVRCLSSKKHSCMNKVGREGLCRDSESKLTFVNEAQILLISEDSVHDLNSRLNSNIEKDFSGSGQPVLVDAMRFRPNLVISGAKPYVEDSWRSLQIGEAQFASLGGCNRCQMINLDQQSGQVRKLKEPLATLASYRRVQGKILFGILLRYEDCIMEDGEERNGKERWLQVGQEVYPSID